MNTYKKIALLAAAVLLLAAMMTVMIGCGKTPAGGTTPTGTQETTADTGVTGQETTIPTGSQTTEDATGTTEQTGGTESTQPVTGGNTGATKPTTGGNTGATQPTTGGNTNTTQPTTPKDPAKVTYEDYEAMSGAEQAAFFATFTNPEDFFTWYNKAKEAYEATKDEIILDGTTPIDLGGLIGSKG